MLAWTLVFHLTGLVFWIGSLLVTTHVLAMHSEEQSPEARATLGRLESKLLKGLAHPGAALMVISGVVLLAEDPQFLRATWLHLKILLVLVMVALDLRIYFRARAFQAGQIEMTRGECMALHGMIALVFTLILILVLIKPFGPPVRGARASSSQGWLEWPARARAGAQE